MEVIMDDILIHGETRAKLDEHYENVLRVIRASGLKLNKDKCLLRQSKLVFMGNLISKDGLVLDPEKVRTKERDRARHVVRHGQLSVSLPPRSVDST